MCNIDPRVTDGEIGSTYVELGDVLADRLGSFVENRTALLFFTKYEIAER